jgi:hypothetical protein
LAQKQSDVQRKCPSVQRREDYITDRDAKGLPVSKIDITFPSICQFDANLVEADTMDMQPSDSGVEDVCAPPKFITANDLPAGVSVRAFASHAEAVLPDSGVHRYFAQI